MVQTLTPKQALVEPIQKLILNAQPAGIVGALKGMAERPDLTGILSHISVPALVLYGTSDQLLQREPVETLAQMLPKGWMVEVANTGHMLMMEEPGQVAEALGQLIQMAVQPQS
jgi:3-oxoadipate enol-lactonase